MEEKMSIKAIQEIKGMGWINIKNVKRFAKEIGFMNENGSITEEGMLDMDIKERKIDHAPYLAVTVSFAKKCIEFLEKEYINKYGQEMYDKVQIFRK